MMYAKCGYAFTVNDEKRLEYWNTDGELDNVSSARFHLCIVALTSNCILPRQRDDFQSMSPEEID